MEFHTAARFGHHWGNGIAPKLVMLGFLVLRGRLRGAVDLDQNPACRIIRLLQDVETFNPGLPYALTGIGQSRRTESFDVLGLDLDVDLDREHRFV